MESLSNTVGPPLQWTGLSRGLRCHWICGYACLQRDSNWNPSSSLSWTGVWLAMASNRNSKQYKFTSLLKRWITYNFKASSGSVFKSDGLSSVWHSQDEKTRKGDDYWIRTASLRLSESHAIFCINPFNQWIHTMGADKSLAQPGRKQTTATKLGI